MDNFLSIAAMALVQYDSDSDVAGSSDDEQQQAGPAAPPPQPQPSKGVCLAGGGRVLVVMSKV